MKLSNFILNHFWKNAVFPKIHAAFRGALPLRATRALGLFKIQTRYKKTGEEAALPPASMILKKCWLCSSTGIMGNVLAQASQEAILGSVGLTRGTCRPQCGHW
jgi:hypothetical protein